MRGRPIVPVLLITVLAPFAAAQQPGAPGDFQPVQTPTPAAPAKPKPKPPAAKKPAPAVLEVKAKLLERIGDWAIHVYEGADGRVCFAASAPTDMKPKTAKRTHVIFYVTTWQKEGIQNEVSVRQGYALKANSAAVTAGGQDFLLSTEEDKAYPKTPADEQKLLAAMAAGGPITVKATSAKGTVTTDQYSAEGLTRAVQKMKEACP